MKKILTIILMAIGITVLASCQQTVEEHDIYVTVYPMKYLTQELFKDTQYTVDIVPGTTSHEHSAEWAPKQIIAMKNASYLFYVGANYDQYIDLKLNVFKDADVQLIRMESEMEFIEGILHEHDHETSTEDYEEDANGNSPLGKDPHFWISPLRMLTLLDIIYDKLLLEFPNEQATLESNYISVKAKLEALNIDFFEAISILTKPVMTSTNLYGYLENDYALDFIPISPGYHEEPDNIMPKNTEEILMEIQYHNITKLIYEKKRTSPATDIIYDEMIRLNIEPEKLYFDILQALSDEEIKNGKDYISVMYENLEALKTAGK
ncbi:MAG: zinc ABC transporter substrate-binding protein [Candidatus Izimaplasma sp.]|nr:zinc ABC transporter substrate-binding protein [Candidatus Izimaplasma bacterium]